MNQGSYEASPALTSPWRVVHIVITPVSCRCSRSTHHSGTVSAGQRYHIDNISVAQRHHIDLAPMSQPYHIATTSEHNKWKVSCCTTSANHPASQLIVHDLREPLKKSTRRMLPWHASQRGTKASRHLICPYRHHTHHPHHTMLILFIALIDAIAKHFSNDIATNNKHTL